MNKPTNTVSAVMKSLIPKSEKAVSENLSTEEFNALGEELTEVQARIDSQTEGNTKVKADYEAAVKRADEAEAKVTTLTESQKDLQGKLQSAEADRDKYKGFYNEQKTAGKELPDEDANSRNADAVPDNHPNKVALRKWEAKNKKPSDK